MSNTYKKLESEISNFISCASKMKKSISKIDSISGSILSKIDHARLSNLINDIDAFSEGLPYIINENIKDPRDFETLRNDPYCGLDKKGYEILSKNHMCTVLSDIDNLLEFYTNILFEECDLSSFEDWKNKVSDISARINYLKNMISLDISENLLKDNPERSEDFKDDIQYYNEQMKLYEDLKN